MATSNNWDLRAGFTKDYDLATSAVSAADKQFVDAQRIIDNAYKLDKTAATQQFDIERMNAENLEKTMASQARVGDFESAQEIQRALESLGTSTVEVPEGQVPQDQQPDPNAVKSMMITEDGRYIEDPKSPIIAAPNEQRPPVAQPRVRPMTRREQLAAIEPMLKTPKAKFALRQMVQKEATTEALALHTIAPDEAFNMLLKEGVIRGTPLVANDDGTYSRMMPDGRNMLRLDRTEAAAYVGDTINKTNNMFKLSENKLKQEQKLMYETQEAANKSTFRRAETQAEFDLRSTLEKQKLAQDIALDNRRTANDAGLIRLRASLGKTGATGGDTQTAAAAGSTVSGAPVVAPEQARRAVAEASPEQATSDAEALEKERAIAKKAGNIGLVRQIDATLAQLRPKAAGAIATTKEIDAAAEKTIREINKIVTGQEGGKMGAVEFNRKIRKLQAAAKKALDKGETDAAKKFLADIEAVKRKASKQ